jgi:phosphotransferase system enzyme I (PtsI)
VADAQEIWLAGIAGSPGIAIGRVHLLDRRKVTVAHYHVAPEGVAGETERLEAALHRAQEQLEEIRAKLEAQGAREFFAILEAHLLMLRDPLLIERTKKRIQGELQNAEWALQTTVKEIKAILDSASEDYFRERRSDIDFVGDRVLRNLQGKSIEPSTLFEPDAVVVAADLSPADTAMMFGQPVLGFATDVGGKTSHTAIMARAMEIPAVLGLDDITEKAGTGDLVILDGYRGEVVLNPRPETVRRFERRRTVLRERDAFLQSGRELPAVTQDGTRVMLTANIELREEVGSCLKHGAEGIGLYRTEFLFMNRESLPSEEEQYAIYREIASCVAPRPVTLRTLDLGGDKFASRVPAARGVNDAMGLRAIRLCLHDEDLFHTQLTAMLRASAHGQVRIMFPMVSGVGEVRQARGVLRRAQDDLARRGLSFDAQVKVGIMVEVPSAAVIADLLAREVDFFSIGTNDLIQYSLAIDRVNEAVAYLYRPLHPAILRLLQRTVDAGRAAGISVSMCGEMAGDPLYALVLLGLGLTELSMNSLSLPVMKRLIREVTSEQGRELLAEALRLGTPEEVEELVHDRMLTLFPEVFEDYEPTHVG